MIDRGLRFAAARIGDDRLILSDAERSDLSDAMNEFQKYHRVPVMSAEWAARIGLLTSVGAVVAARVEIITNPAPAGQGSPTGQVLGFPRPVMATGGGSAADWTTPPA